MRLRELGLPRPPAQRPGNSLLAQRRRGGTPRDPVVEAVEWSLKCLSRYAQSLGAIRGSGWAYGVQLDRFLTLSQADVYLDALPPAFDGVRVLLLTDIHTGPFLAADALERTLARLATLEPDVVLLGGDLITSKPCDLLPHGQALSSLSAPLGVFAVPGNHEHIGNDLDRVAELLDKAGIAWLQNRAAWLKRGNERVLLGGLDDALLGKPDLEAALSVPGEPRPPASARQQQGEPCAILLSHNPDVFFDALERGVSLVCSGHTHGGQIRLPGLPLMARASRYHLNEGRYELDGCELVVSRGLGVTGLPLRVACPPEAVLLTLRC